jgi:hypothetical protein
MGPTTAASMTPQGQATDSLQSVLAQISGMAQQAPQDPTTAVTNAFQGGVNAAQPGQVQQVTNQLSQQAGIPALQGQQQNLGQIFGMYLADQNLAQKYSGASLNTPNSPVYNSGLTPQTGMYTGNTSQVPNPYLASPQALINAVTQPSGQGFQGVTTPGQNTAAIGAVPSSAQQLISMLTGLQSNEQGLVNTDVSNYEGQYGNIMNQLSTILGNQSEQAFSQAQPGSAQSVQKSLNNLKADVDSGMTLTQLIQKYSTDPNMTADKVYQMYNAKHSQPGDKWGPAKESAQQLADLGITGAPVTQAAAAAKPPPTKTIGGEVMEYNPATKSYDIPAGGNQAIKQSQDMLDNYLNKWKSMNVIEKDMPQSIASAVPGLFPDRAYLDTDFFTQIEPLLRKQVVGGRITQQELTWLKNALPKFGDSDESATQKIDAIKQALSGGIGSASGGSNGSTSQSDPLGIL